MDDFDETDYAPYAPVQNILLLIHRLRERGLPEVLDHRRIVELGLPEESSSRIRKALRFLDFTDSEGKQTPTFQRLGRATDDEYPELLKAILENAYTAVFQSLGDVAAAQERDYQNAFRYYNPQGQRPSMIRLFMALCQEAGMLPEGAVTRVSKTKPTQKPQSSRAVVKRKEDQSAADTNTRRPVNRGFSDDPLPPSDKNASDGSVKYQLMQVLLKQLPADGIWTQKRHDQWLKAVETSIDLLVEIAEPENENQNRPQQPELPL